MMFSSKLVRLVADFESSMGENQPLPKARVLLARATLTAPPMKAPDESGEGRQYGEREEAEKNAVGAFADHLETLMFSSEESRYLVEDGSAANLLARATVTSGNGEKLLARWQEFCEMLESDTRSYHNWIRYRYSFGCRNQFLLGAMAIVGPPAEIMPQLLELCTSALGAGAIITTNVNDGGNHETATLITIDDKVANYVRSHAADFGFKALLAEADRLRRVSSSRRSRQTLNWSLINILMKRLGDDSLLATEVLGQVNRLFPRNVDVGKALAALQALELPA